MITTDERKLDSIRASIWAAMRGHGMVGERPAPPDEEEMDYRPEQFHTFTVAPDQEEYEAIVDAPDEAQPDGPSGVFTRPRVKRTTIELLDGTSVVCWADVVDRSCRPTDGGPIIQERFIFLGLQQELQD